MHDDLDKILSEISTESSKAGRTEIEIQRLANGLKTVLLRLVSEQYKWSSFNENTFSIPERTQEFYTNLLSYQPHAEGWERILAILDLQGSYTIVDLCSGWAPKLALGLIYAQFNGKLILLDRDSDAMDALTRFLNFFRPKFSIEKQVSNIAVDIPKLSGDLVIANHIIDDLIMEYSANRFGHDFASVYQDEQSYLALWQVILGQERSIFAPLVQQLVTLIDRLVAPKGYIIFTHYLSFIDKLLNFTESGKFSIEMMNEVAQRLIDSGSFTVQTSGLDRIKDLRETIFSGGEIVILKRV